MSNERRPGEHVLTEAEVHAVLRRAVEIESKGTGGLTLEEVRRIAREAGISPTALEAAFREVLETAQSPAPAEPPPPPKPPSLLRRLLRPAALAGMGLLVGAWTAWWTGGYGLDDPLAAALLAVASLKLAFHHRRRGDQESFQTDTVALWAGLAAAWVFGGDVANPWGGHTIILDPGGAATLYGMIRLIGVGWLTSATLGGVIVHTGRGGDGPAAEDGAAVDDRQPTFIMIAPDRRE